jgi:signal transduction histidine kinase
MDSGDLFILAGYGEKGRALIETGHRRFEAALDVELNNITLSREGEKAAHLRDLYARYSLETEAFLAPALTAEARRSAYLRGLLPLFTQIKDTAEEILRLNQDSMTRANDRARAEAAAARRQMYALLAAALLLGCAFIFFTGRWILRPIGALIKSTEEISRGNLDLVITPGSKDEIGRLSESFNTMAQSLRAFRRSDQARLARVQRATQQTFRNLPEAVAVLDLSGCVEVATDAAAEAFALRPGAHVQELEPRLLAELFEGALAHERSRPLGEGVIQHFARGEERFFRPRALPIPGPDALPAGVLLVLEDVTQWHLQEEMKRGVIAMVSHQLKTPLTSVRMALHLLLEEKVGPLNRKQIDLLLAAREDGDRLHATLEDLLDMSRLQSGRAPLELAPARCEELVDEALEPFFAAAQDEGVKLQEDLPADLPDVRADRGRIQHAFGNLLSNALKYTSAGGSVTVSGQEEGEAVRFSVADTGRGIPAEVLPHVFDQFYRVPGDREAGVGLGLAIVKEIVEAHGGAVRAESQEGRGSTFSFTLPKSEKGRWP